MSRKLIASLCPYCAVGCGLYLEVDKGRATGIEYMTDHPAYQGALCPKGNALLEILNHVERLKYPLKKVGEGFVRITWDEALDLVAMGLSRNLRKHGPKSQGFLASSRCNNEENYLMQKMARLLGSPNVDNCARLCHSPTVAGLGASFGAGAIAQQPAGPGELEVHLCHRHQLHRGPPHRLPLGPKGQGQGGKSNCSRPQDHLNLLDG